MSLRIWLSLLSLPLLVASCVSLRSQGTSPSNGIAIDPAAQSPPDSAAEDIHTIAEPVPSLPEHVFFRRAFRDLQWADEAGAAARLDSACLVLGEHIDSGQVDLERTLAGVRIVVELYHDLMPEAAPIDPESALGRLLAGLPETPSSVLSAHPYYRELHLRCLAGMVDVPIDLTPEVRESIEYFTTVSRNVFKLWLERSADYEALIRSELQAAGLPKDLMYLAMVESGFNPKAYSAASAVGIWQFTGNTGRLYGLRDNTWIDERRDPVKSTRAAVRHLAHLDSLFNDWRMVIAAYNCGQGRLARAMQTSGSDWFWKLDSLPRETRKHVPRFMAAALISKDPGWFGFEAPGEGLLFNHETVTVIDCVDLRVAAECAGTSYERMRLLNPELRRGYTPPVKGKSYSLRVPPGTGGRFQERYARLPVGQRLRMVDYRVGSGETVSQIARKMGVSSQVVMDANQIRDARRLREGAMLQIPLHPDLLARYTGSKESARAASSPDPFSHVRMTYRVRPGDTLWGIARQEGVTAEKVRDWNGLKRSQHIYPGDRLVIWKPGSDGPKAKAGGALAAQMSDEYYTIRGGDTLWGIARTFGTSVTELKRWNGIQKTTLIRANTKLRVKPPDAAVD